MSSRKLIQLSIRKFNNPAVGSLGSRWNHCTINTLAPISWNYFDSRGRSKCSYHDYRKKQYALLPDFMTPTSELLVRKKKRHLSSSPTRLPNSRQRSENESDSSTKVEANIADVPIKSTSGKTTSTTTSDPPVWTWIDTHLPSSLQPYARLARVDKPIGTWLLLWPCAWSTALAADVGHLPDPTLLALFTGGAFIMRGAGCTINDLWDQDIDRKVSRTSSRPLAAGDLTTQRAIGFLALQMTAGLGILLSLPHLQYCFVWGVSSLPLVIAYPLMKRYTDYPQLVLGLTFNWGAWMGWAAVHGSMDYSVIGPLYFSGVTWTLVYDTIYANQDKTDDAKLGLRSTALTFGSDHTRHKRILHGLAAVTYLQWLLAGYNADFSSFGAYALGMSSAYGHLVWQIQTAELDNPHNLMERFRSNATVGALVFGSIVGGKML